MKKICEKYNFNPINRTVEILDNFNIEQESIVLITNVTDGIIIYNFADSTMIGTLNQNILTLNYDTSLMASTDHLMIIFDTVDEQEESLTAVDKVIELFDTNNANVTLWGDIAPASQWQREQSNYDQLSGLMTYDITSEKIFGSQRLENNGKLKTEDYFNDITVNGRLQATNQAVIITLNGMSTAAVQITGTWAGTITFQASLNGSDYVAVAGLISTGNTSFTSTTTANGLFRFPVSGYKYFQCIFTTATSGIASIIINASTPDSVLHQAQVGTLGSQGSLLSQRGTTFESITYDSSGAPAVNLIKDALSSPDWNPNAKGYFIGDTVLYNGQLYQCIAATSNTVANLLPTNTTYWQLDQRQNKNIVTSLPANPANSKRLMVEIDLDAYQYRLLENQDMYSRLYNQNQMLYQDMILQDNNPYGRRQSQGQDGMSHYLHEEIR